MTEIPVTLVFASVSENSHRLRLVIILCCTYSLGSNNGSSYFHIDSERGILLTKQKLDHEQKKTLDVVVVATDHGIPALSSSVNVHVIVLDLNDNAPTFDQPSYEVGHVLLTGSHTHFFAVLFF